MENSTKPLLESPEKILVLRLSALGDVLHCLPAVEALHELWPDATLDWVTESLAAPLLEGHPLIRRIVKLPRKAWGKLMRSPKNYFRVAREARHFVRDLRQERYDLIVDFQGNMRSVIIAGLARGGTKACHHSSEVKDKNHWFRAHRPPEPSGWVHRVEKNMHLLRFLGWSGDGTPTARLPGYEEELADLPPLPEDAAYVHPFVSAYGRFKEWPPQHYVALAKRLNAQGMPVVVSWAPEDLEVAEQIVADAGEGTTLAPPTPSMRHVAAMLREARVIVAGDTGILHLGVALGRPVVGLYGPKDPRRYAPWTENSRTLRGDVPCSPCTLRTCEHSICMQMIQPKHVEGAVHEVLEHA